jgi:hypothetical protein
VLDRARRRRHGRCWGWRGEEGKASTASRRIGSAPAGADLETTLPTLASLVPDNVGESRSCSPVNALVGSADVRIIVLYPMLGGCRDVLHTRSTRDHQPLPAARREEDRLRRRPARTHHNSVIRLHEARAGIRPTRWGKAQRSRPHKRLGLAASGSHGCAARETTTRISPASRSGAGSRAAPWPSEAPGVCCSRPASRSGTRGCPYCELRKMCLHVGHGWGCV